VGNNNQKEKQVEDNQFRGEPPENNFEDEDEHNNKRSKKKTSKIGTFMIIWFLICLSIPILYFVRGNFVDKEKGIRAAEIHGFTNIKVVDHEWFLVLFNGCDVTDAARIVMTATNSQNQEVDIYACSGWPFKGATIRTD
jgi:hypothetical protein